MTLITPTVISSASFAENKNKKSAEKAAEGEVKYSVKSEIDSYNIKKWNDYIHVQKQVIDTIKKEGFLGEEKRLLIYNKNLSADIELNYGGIKETIGFDTFQKMPKSVKEKKIATIRMLPDIIKNADVEEPNADNYHDPNLGINYTYLEMSVIIDGKPNRAKIDIKKSRRKNKFWVHSIYEIKENQTLLVSSGLTPKLAVKEMSDFQNDDITVMNKSQENNSDIKKSPKVLDTEYLNATESGDVETSQRLVDEVGKAKNDGLYHIYDLTKKIRDTANRINGLERPKPNEGYALENDVSKNSISKDSKKST